MNKKKKETFYKLLKKVIAKFEKGEINSMEAKKYGMLLIIDFFNLANNDVIDILDVRSKYEEKIWIRISIVF